MTALYVDLKSVFSKMSQIEISMLCSGKLGQVTQEETLVRITTDIKFASRV